MLNLKFVCIQFSCSLEGRFRGTWDGTVQRVPLYDQADPQNQIEAVPWYASRAHFSNHCSGQFRASTWRWIKKGRQAGASANSLLESKKLARQLDIADW